MGGGLLLGLVPSRKRRWYPFGLQWDWLGLWFLGWLDSCWVFQRKNVWQKKHGFAHEGLTDGVE